MYLSRLKNLNRVLQLSGRQAVVWMILGIAGTLLLSLVELGIAAMIPLLLKTLGLMSTELDHASTLASFNLPIWLLSLSFVALGIVRFLGQYLVNQSGVAAQEEVNVRLRKILIYRILLHPNQSYMASTQSNYLLGSSFPNAGVCVYLITISLSQVLQLCCLGIVMFSISWKEATVGVLGLGMIGLFVRQINHRITARSALIPRENRQIVSGFERVAKNWLLVRVLNTQVGEHQRFLKSIVNVFEHSTRSAAYSNLASSGAPLLGIFLVVLLLFLGNSQWNTPGTILISFIYIFIRFVQSLSGTVGSATQINRYVPQLNESLKFFFEFSKKEIAEALAGKAADLSASVESWDHYRGRSTAPEICFHNVSFGYDGFEVLSGVSLTIPAGTTFGIIGPSGVGKTTLLQLLLGSLSPQSGQIQIAGSPAAELLAKQTVRIGYVGPEPFLFEGSIRENLTYGIADVPEDFVWKALADARLLDAVRDLPGQLDHPIQENGEGLSAGQKQRLCIARVFLRKPALVILDEATANLDSRTEEDIVDSLKAVMADSTTVIVTHRLAALKHADVIYDMEHKRLRDLRWNDQAKTLTNHGLSLTAKELLI